MKTAVFQRVDVYLKSGMKKQHEMKAMKKLLVAMIVASLGCLAAAPNALAAKADGKKAKLIAKYDKNGNGIIDGEEKDAIRKDYAANPNGELKAYDKDGDGKLSDEEIAAIKPGSGSAKSGEKSKDKAKKKSKEGEKDAGQATGTGTPEKPKSDDSKAPKPEDKAKSDK